MIPEKWLRPLSLVSHWLRRRSLPFHSFLVASAVCAALVAVGVCMSWHFLTFIAAVAGLCAGGFALGQIRAHRDAEKMATLREQVAAAVVGPHSHSETSGLVDEMLAQGRFALLLRPQIAGNLTCEQLQLAERSLKRAMTVVPAGEVLLGVAEDDLNQGIGGVFESGFVPSLVQVEEFWLDRFAVTNREFSEFVRAGGYKQMALWDPVIWPAVSSLVDTTGVLAPRFWKDGCYPHGLREHPVVGVSYYEAAAYARWVGKRLPTEAEWEKAASWPLPMGQSGPRQRRFPWGDSLAPGKANLWSTGRNATVPVDEFLEGCSAGGVQQMVGNVWEWTSDELDDPRLSLLFPMKCIRGGAFDTYFENQATCQFRSGETPVNRRHNIGFRCALGACDMERSATRDQVQAQSAAVNKTSDVDERYERVVSV